MPKLQRSNYLTAGNGGSMISNQKLALVVGLTGWALTYVIAKSRKQMHHQEKKLQKKQMTTWEGEGGNLPPATTTSTQPGIY
jgi:hypothetical protein